MSRECPRNNVICLFCKSYEHVIEDCPTLLQRIQEKRPLIANQNIQLITTESFHKALELNIITWSGLNIEGIPKEKEHHPNVAWVRPTTTKDHILDLHKQTKTFLQAKQDFCDKGASSSNTKDIRREPTTIPLQTNPCIEEVQHQVNIETYEESEHLALVKSFI